VGDGVAERTKAPRLSVATCTVAGLNLGHGRYFSSGSHGIPRSGMAETKCPIENPAK